MSFGVFSFGHIGCEPEHLNTMLSFSADQVSVLSPLPLHHPTSLPFASLTCHHKTIPALSVRAHPPLDIFSSHFVDRVGYVSFRTFSKWHWKNSRAPSDAGTRDAAEPSEERSLPAESPPSFHGNCLRRPWFSCSMQSELFYLFSFFKSGQDVSSVSSRASKSQE